MDLQEVVLEVMDWIHLAEDRVLWMQSWTSGFH